MRLLLVILSIVAGIVIYLQAYPVIEKAMNEKEKAFATIEEVLEKK